VGGTPEETKAWVRGYYAEATELYVRNWGGSTGAFHLGLDDGTCSTRDEALQASNRYLAERAGVTQGTRVLDAGCGVGGSSVWLALHRDARVVGITIAPEQLAIARKRAEEAGVLDRVRFEEMDFAATTFVPGSFDVVWNLESLVHAFDTQAYLRHVHELLRPGGKFVCLEMVSNPGGDAAIARAMCEGWSLSSLPGVDETMAQLRTAGFVDVESDDLLEQIRRPVLAMKAFAENASRMLAIEKAMTGSSSAVYAAHVRGALACAEGVANGTFGYAYVGATRPPVASGVAPK
jgi:cyclopropane fatty-acyl-phospholipid synthase-like methyltransferase